MCISLDSSIAFLDQWHCNEVVAMEGGVEFV